MEILTASKGASRLARFAVAQPAGLRSAEQLPPLRGGAEQPSGRGVSTAAGAAAGARPSAVKLVELAGLASGISPPWVLAPALALAAGGSGALHAVSVSARRPPAWAPLPRLARALLRAGATRGARSLLAKWWCSPVRL